jgi:hypothetical protein
MTGDTGTVPDGFNAAQTGLEVMVFLLQPPEGWDAGITGVYHYVPLCFFFLFSFF